MHIPTYTRFRYSNQPPLPARMKVHHRQHRRISPRSNKNAHNNADVHIYILYIFLYVYIYLYAFVGLLSRRTHLVPNLFFFIVTTFDVHHPLAPHHRHQDARLVPCPSSSSRIRIQNVVPSYAPSLDTRPRPPFSRYHPRPLSSAHSS